MVKTKLLKTAYLWTAAFGWWDTGADPLMPSDFRLGIAPNKHVAHPDAKRLAHELIEVTGLLDHLDHLPIQPAQEKHVLLVHDKQYVDRVKRESNLTGGDCGDGVSPFGRGGFDLALHGVGAALTLLESVVSGETRNGYALVHPAGHHAEPDRGRGFCMFNNGAISAEYAIKTLGLKKVAIVDLDVHHGNGAEKIFWKRNDVLTISIHQDRCFPPDSGFASSRGAGKGFGYNMNVPLPPGSGTDAYLYSLKTLVLPALRRFKPDVILVASGLDANIMDPLARQSVTADGFAEITRQMVKIADELVGGKLVYLQEGGYSPAYVPICIHRVIETLANVTTLPVDPYGFVINQQYGTALEPWQRKAIDGYKGMLKDIK
ncbi:hypothetical protein JCM10450v2_005685 [Rhodotorula kratochvilovae]